MDKYTERLIREAIDGFTSSRDGKHYIDELGPAVYRIEPAGSECMALACPACSLVTIRPGSPTNDRITVACSGCGKLYELAPPAEVVAFGRLGITIAAPIEDPRAPRLGRLARLLRH